MLRSIGRIDVPDLSRVLGVEDRLQLALRMCALARRRWQRTRRPYGDNDADHERERRPYRQRQESLTHLPLPVGWIEYRGRYACAPARSTRIALADQSAKVWARSGHRLRMTLRDQAERVNVWGVGRGHGGRRSELAASG